MITRKIGYDILHEIKELELDYMEYGYMLMKGHKRGHGTSRKLMVVVKLHLTLYDMIKTVKMNFMSLRLVYFHNHSLLLIHDQITITEHF